MSEQHATGAVVTPANPYLSNQSPAPLPDLDAAAPVLPAADSQRLNRKALGFLAGMILFLVLMTLWMIHSASAARDSTPRQREEAVAVPDLPRASAGEATPVHPAMPANDADVEEVPPLPLLPPPPAERAAMTAPTPPLPAGPTLAERRMGVQPTDTAPGPGSDPIAQALLAGLPRVQAGGAEQPVQPAATDTTTAQYLQHPDALLLRGTYIRCILESRIVTDVPGFASCVVTEPVYSVNGQRLLIPKGSKISGKYNGEPSGPRVAVVWDRITTPSGIDVTMASPGVDDLGSAGHPGDYDAHWGSRIGASMMISLISDGFRYAAAEYGPETTTIANGVVTQSPFESTTARTMERLANQALAKAANRPATVTIPQGTALNVYVARDVDFSGVLARQ
jgi:type IV secretion system protein VirB10